jgi:anti-anti-sigma regulatory factor
MAVAVDVDEPLWARGQRWLRTDDLGEDAVLIRVWGGIAADRAEQLWEAIETALEWAVGRPVVVDLTQVTGFDVGSIEELADTARASVRRHADLCAVVKPRSALDHYVRCCGLLGQLPLYDSLTAALAVSATNSGSSTGEQAHNNDRLFREYVAGSCLMHSQQDH